jgi:hypothetical protein
MLNENGMQPGRPEGSQGSDAPATVDVADSSPAVGTERWGLMNRRRSELIRKKNRQGLTADERAEFERLQRLCLSAIREKFPPPVADEDGLKRLRESR